MDTKKRKFFKKAMLVCLVIALFGNFFISNAAKSYYATEDLNITTDNLSVKAQKSEALIYAETSIESEISKIPDISEVENSSEDLGSEASIACETSNTEEYEHSTEEYSTEEYSAEEYSTEEYSTEEYSAEEYSVGIYDSSCESISYTERDLFMFEATMYVEGGAQGTPYEIQVANCWIARNKIEQKIEEGSADPFRDALNPNHYQGVKDDEFGWRAVSIEEGVVTQELIDSNPSIHEISIGVLTGNIPSPIYDWDCTQCFDYFGFDNGVYFAEEVGINQYIIIENGIYFPASEWTEKLTWYCMNY